MANAERYSAIAAKDICSVWRFLAASNTWGSLPLRSPWRHFRALRLLETAGRKQNQGLLASRPVRTQDLLRIRAAADFGATSNWRGEV
jgi:hypothetical protein